MTRKGSLAQSLLMGLRRYNLQWHKVIKTVFMLCYFTQVIIPLSPNRHLTKIRK
jgi:hypothetical protein